MGKDMISEETSERPIVMDEAMIERIIPLIVGILQKQGCYHMLDLHLTSEIAENDDGSHVIILRSESHAVCKRCEPWTESSAAITY